MAKALILSIIKGAKHSFYPSDQPYGERMIYEDYRQLPWLGPGIEGVQ